MSNYSWAEPVYPIDPQQYGMHKAFGPPKPITPKTVLTATPENQFDRAQRDIYPNAVNRVNDRVDKPLHLTIGQFADSTYTGALWRQRKANYYVIGDVDYSKAKDYKDGDNQTVNYGYDRKGGALVLGLLPTLTMEHRLTLLYDDIDDDKQPQHVMDPINTRRVIGKYNGRFGAQDNSNTLHFELSAVDLKRNANNFDLRSSPNPKTPKIFMDVKRQKYAADMHYNFQFNKQNRSSIGLHYQDDSHDAKRFIKTPKGSMQNGYRFPDVKTKTTRLYASHEWQPTAQHSLKGALDYTWQKANPRAANKKFIAGKNPQTGQPITISSAGLWQNYYGKKLAGDIKQDGLSGKLRYTFTATPNQQFYGELASLYRMPENPERFAVLPGPGKNKKNPIGKGWADNPWIEPERENRLTLGTTLNGALNLGYNIKW